MLAPPESPVLETPRWLDALEKKRNRPHKLAHDVGAGAPCLVCGDGCKGLNLHFWRKLCIECKCRKEDHDVKDEDQDYAQFEILFGAKKVKQTTIRFNKQSRTFDWIPPNVTPELAVEYLSAIPENRLPISDSEGGKHRKQQLERQLPRHDVDPTACHDLSDKELLEFCQYLDNLKNNVIGQGKVLKYQSPILHQEYAAYGVKLNISSTADVSHSQPQVAGITGTLKQDQAGFFTAVSGNVNTQSFPAAAHLQVFSTGQQHAAIEDNKTIQGNSYPAYRTHSQQNTIQPMTAQNLLPKSFQSSSWPTEGTPQVEKEKLEKPFSLKKPSEFVTNRTSPVFDNQNNNTNPDRNDNLRSLVPYPTDVSTDIVSMMNQFNVSSDQVPFVGVQESQVLQGKTHRVAAPAGLTQSGQERRDDDVTAMFPEPPATCAQCLLMLTPQDIVVSAERAGNTALWHARCFVCRTCNELLVDLMYFFHKGDVYCGRHYSEMMDIPRCFACDELIFSKEYTCAEAETFHIRHFCCYHCDQPLADKQYIPKDGQPVCLDCYQLKYGKSCNTCRQPIAAGEQRVSWKELDFHVAANCFRCGQCRKSLLGGRFVVKNDETFCSKECVQAFVN